MHRILFNVQELSYMYIDDFMYKKLVFIEILGTYEFVGLIFDSS
jgi:hypothetical protein